MKKLRFMLSCMAAVLAIVACSEKEELPAPDQGPGNENPDDSDPDDPGTPDDGMTYEMTAAYPQFAAAAAEGAVAPELAWAEGDVLKVVAAGATEAVDFKYDAEGKYFTASADFEDGAELAVAYNAGAVPFTFTLPDQTQSAAEVNVAELSKALFMYSKVTLGEEVETPGTNDEETTGEEMTTSEAAPAETETETKVFSVALAHQTALYRFTLTNASGAAMNVAKIEVEGSEETAFAKTLDPATAAYSGNAKTLALALGADAGLELAADASMTAYLSFFPTPAANSTVTYKVYVAGEEEPYYASEAQTVSAVYEAGKVYDVAISLEAAGSDEPVVEEGYVVTDGVGHIYDAAGLTAWAAAYGKSETGSDNVVVEKDIDMNNAEWTPVANFSGTFDGQGYTISNMAIKAGVPATGFVGTNAGTLKNLTFDNVSYEASSASGLFVGMNNGAIQNCNVKSADFTVTTATAGYYGIIAGANLANESLISDCTVGVEDGTVSVTIEGNNVGHKIGGIAGVNGNNSGVKPTLASCAVNSDVTITVTGMQSAVIDMGGIVGWFAGGKVIGSVSRCTMNILAASLGGVAGHIQGPHVEIMAGCYTTATINVEQPGTGKQAGLIGKTFNAPVKVAGCYSNATVPESEYVGQIVQESNGTKATFTSCYSVMNTESCPLIVKTNNETAFDESVHTDNTGLQSKLSEMNTAIATALEGTGYTCKYVEGTVENEPLTFAVPLER